MQRGGTPFSAGNLARRPAGSGERKPSTPTQLSTHLACAHYTQIERKRRPGVLELEFMSDPRLEAMRERDTQHERAYIERLRQAGSSILDLRKSTNPRQPWSGQGRYRQDRATLVEKFEYVSAARQT